MPAELLVPEDDPMDGTTTSSTRSEDTDPGLSLQIQKAIESSSTGEGYSEGSVACDNMPTKVEKDSEDTDRNDGASAVLFHEATENSKEFAGCEQSG